MKILNNIKKISLDCLFPPVCINCRKNIDNQYDYLCNDCFSQINFFDGIYCPKCNKRQTELTKNCYCSCPYLIAPACKFENPIKNLLYSYKYRKLERIKFFMSALLIYYLKKINLNIDSYVITFIPLHPKKERERGFNQTKNIAEIIAQKNNTNVLNLLKRIRNNKPQAKVQDKKEREKNAKDCFEVITSENICEKNILIIDDVSTTGATLESASISLKKAGAKNIIALVVAKA